MTIARARLVSIETTPYYHVIGRCVRRAFLCGVDETTGKDFEHRRKWVIERLELLCSVFAIELCSFAVMHNHYHLVVRLAPEQAKNWTQDQVLSRWEKLYGIPMPVLIGLAPDAGNAQRQLASEMIEVRRDRLADLSWFMKCLNEYIARRANLEDGCTGAFWEGRYKSQALLDERALLTCMAYVDLNPIRAGMAGSLEESDYTSIQSRIAAAQGRAEPLPLVAFEDQQQPGRSALPYYLRHYIELVDWTGKSVSNKKRGVIPANVEPILDRLGFDESTWLEGIKLFGRPMFQAIGPANMIRQAANAQQRCWYRGISACQAVFGPN